MLDRRSSATHPSTPPPAARPPPAPPQQQHHTHRNVSPQHNNGPLNWLSLFALLLRSLAHGAKQIGILVAPLLRIPGVALHLVKAIWRVLLQSWLGQTSLALAASLASFSVHHSCALTRGHEQQGEGGGRRRPVQGLTASLGTRVALLWGCFRCVQLCAQDKRTCSPCFQELLTPWTMPCMEH